MALGHAVLLEANHPFKIPVGLKIAPSVAKVADLLYAHAVKWTVWGAQDFHKGRCRGHLAISTLQHYNPKNLPKWHVSCLVMVLWKLVA